jgi:hypothetical protein
MAITLPPLPQGVGSDPQALVLALNDRLRRISAAVTPAAVASAAVATTTTSGTVTHSLGPLTAGYAVFGNGADDLKAVQPRGNTLVAQLADNTTNPAAGNLAVFDAHGNIKDGGAPVSGTSVFFDGTIRVASHTATGTAGQIGYDSAAFFYFCYAANLWVRIGAAGYTMGF